MSVHQQEISMARGRKKSVSKRNSLLYNLFIVLSNSYIYKILVFLFVLTIIIAISILATGNNFDKFFFVLGIEVFVVIITGCIIFIRDIKK
jgi:hypothetical protein